MNTSDDDKLIDWNNELSTNYIVNDVFLGLYLILGIFGNVVVIIIYSFRMKKKKDDRYFIPFLAVMDLFACASRSSLELAMNINPVNFRGSEMCKALWFPTNVSAVSSIFLLLVIAVQRYLKICRPFGPQMTLFWKQAFLLATVVIAVGFSIPLIFYNDEIEVKNSTNNVTGCVCDVDVERYYGTGFLTYTIISIISSFSIMLALMICNALIGRQIYIQTKAKIARINQNQINRSRVSSTLPLVLMNIAPDISENVSVSETTKLNNNNLTNSETDTKSIRKMSFAHRYSFMFMAIGIAFIISYVPRLIVLMVSLRDPKFFGKLSPPTLAFVAFIREMNVVNNVVNPFIYGFFDRRFRKETKNCFVNMNETECRCVMIFE
ncbi:CCKAR [Mytilus edulis]|uniref:CCKAR n=1 Tax=Mytilus edulis TaxID=6550 RepID=A0A8S3V3F6_MYTED|nr:CCKAR [Mytilus edulis]